MKNLGLVLGLALLSSTTSFAQLANDEGSGKGLIKIYDAKYVPGIISLFYTGIQVLEEGEPLMTTKRKVPKDAIALHKNLVKVREFYKERYNRNSYDNKGADIKASVNVNRFAWPDILGQRQNAAWMSTRFSFGAGKGISFKGSLDNFAQALDVVGHEFTHAVIQETSNLEYEGQSGALNEHFADVFGVLINQHYNKPENPYLVGGTVLKGKYKRRADGLRDMLHPHNGLSVQPEHMSELKTNEKFKVLGYDLCKEGEDPKLVECCLPSGDNDHCGVHTLSGIPNRAAALILTKMRWDDAGKMFYKVMTEKLSERSNFADYAKALQAECKNIPGACAVVQDALQDVGIIK